MKRSASHVALTLLMDVLVLLAVVVTTGMVVSFFGALESAEFGEKVASIASSLTAPLGLPEWKTPYSGVFRADSAATVAVILGIEWFLSIVRRRGTKD